MRKGDRHRTLSNRARDSLGRAVTGVPCGEEPWNACLERQGVPFEWPPLRPAAMLQEIRPRHDVARSICSNAELGCPVRPRATSNAHEERPSPQFLLIASAIGNRHCS